MHMLLTMGRRYGAPVPAESIAEAVETFIRRRNEYERNGGMQRDFIDGKINTGATILRITWNGTVMDWGTGRVIKKDEWPSYKGTHR